MVKMMIAMPPEVKDVLDQEAQGKGLSTAAYIRMVVIEKLGLEARQVRRPRGRPRKRRLLLEKPPARGHNEGLK